ncbi:tyrosine- and lysine-rich protein [Dorcoceras hygrometricum]|uniref:Tyrosine-and lysine-rich protein n=1 Tax=Dorcoceras hygrometricum TaxID=472368 RepID=A0A2Z7DB54_9LAMI|nr:tyrosine- and lysine-rich protein [Dorcoceras hygrometricum]
MGLNSLFFLSFFLVTYLVISSHVAARELAATSNTQVNDKNVKTTEDYSDPGVGCPFGCCGAGWGYGEGCWCCRYAGQIPDDGPKN